MKPSAIVIAAAVALIPVAGLAEQRSASDLAERVLDYLYPHRVRRLPVPFPPSRPAEIAPVPEPAPQATPSPKEVMPDQSVFHERSDKTQPASADQERPARADLPSVVPTPSPPRQADRTFRKDERRRTSTQQRQQKQIVETPSCFDVRFGASMSCDIIRANTYQYDRLTDAQKCQTRKCLTPAQIKGIESCFPTKQPNPCR